MQLEAGHRHASPFPL